MKTQQEYDDFLEKVRSRCVQCAEKTQNHHILTYFIPDKICSNAEESYIDVYATVPEEAMNLIGSTHGGYIAAFLDHWLGACSRCFSSIDLNTQGITTADFQINFIKATKAGDVLRYHIEKCHVGKRTIIVRATVYCEDKIVAIATQNLAIISLPTDKKYFNKI